MYLKTEYTLHNTYVFIHMVEQHQGTFSLMFSFKVPLIKVVHYMVFPVSRHVFAGEADRLNEFILGRQQVRGGCEELSPLKVTCVRLVLHVQQKGRQ